MSIRAQTAHILHRRNQAVKEPAGSGESIEGAALSYPYAVEHEGELYVAYSNDGARGANRNSAERAVTPVPNLRAE